MRADGDRVTLVAFVTSAVLAGGNAVGNALYAAPALDRGIGARGVGRSRFSSFQPGPNQSR